MKGDFSEFPIRGLPICRCGTGWRKAVGSPLPPVRQSLYPTLPVREQCFYPFWPGISERAYTQEKLDWYSAKRLEYDGKKLTDYECSQIQRSYERDIRETKRTIASYDAAQKAATDEQAAAALKEQFESENVKLKEQEAKLKNFCKETNRTVDSARTQVVAYEDSSGRIVNFGRSTSMKAVWASKKSSLTTSSPAVTLNVETGAADIVQKIVQLPQSLKDYTPDSLKKALEDAGYIVKPLAKGSLKGIAFEDGGGFKVNFGGDGIIQYHPAAHSHHNGEYYKISTAKEGIKHYGIDGTEQPTGRTKQNK